MTKAPLNFYGQKRNSILRFRRALSRYDDNIIIVDLFGGSGLLSHIAKEEKPNSRVIWNDYDNYKERLDNIHDTERLRVLLYESFKGRSLSFKKRMSAEDKEIALGVISSFDGYKDWRTIGRWLLFSNNKCRCFDDLKKTAFYFCVGSMPLCADGYLEGVERVRCDYKELIDKYEDKDNVLFVVDPPYLNTHMVGYENIGSWQLRDYLDVVKNIKDKHFIYFTSDKTNIYELFQWIGENKDVGNVFANSDMEVNEICPNWNNRYTDMMICSR